MRFLYYIIMALILMPVSVSAQKYIDEAGRLKVIIIKDPYSDSRSGPEILQGPDLLEKGELKDVLGRSGCEIINVYDVKMPEESEREYGEWNRASITNRALGRIISSNNQDEIFIIGLLSGSKSLTGMLAGLQHIGPGRSPLKDSRGKDIIGLPRLGEGKPLKVGLVWIDSKGAFNTPDITIEGDMDGMNVAVAAGLCNTTLRLQSGLDPPLSTKYIVMAGVHDTNPYEQLNIDNSFIEILNVEDIRKISDNVDIQMERLSLITDIIYVHVDLSVINPEEIPGHPEAVAGGPTSEELAAFLEALFKYKKTAAFGVAALHDDAEEVSIKVAYRLIEGVIKGLKSR